MKRIVYLLSLAIGLVCTLHSAQGATIVVGSHFLLANTANQPIDISVIGSETNVQGVEIDAMVADGGPLAGGTIVGPKINGDLLTPGAIFAINNTGVVDGNSSANPGIFGPQLLVISTTTTGTSVVTDNGLLVRLLIDTTGFNIGTWTLRLDTSPDNGPTFFGLQSGGSAPLQITPGSITIVPEPSSLVLAAFAVVGLISVWRRRRA